MRLTLGQSPAGWDRLFSRAPSSYEGSSCEAGPPPGAPCQGCLGGSTAETQPTHCDGVRHRGPWEPLAPPSRSALALLSGRKPLLASAAPGGLSCGSLSWGQKEWWETPPPQRLPPLGKDCQEHQEQRWPSDLGLAWAGSGEGSSWPLACWQGRESLWARHSDLGLLHSADLSALRGRPLGAGKTAAPSFRRCSE